MILKMHTVDGDSVFIDLGKEYTVIKKDFPNFKSRLKGTLEENESLSEKIFAFLEYGITSMALYKGTPYYVFTEGGRLFDTLTFR